MGRSGESAAAGGYDAFYGPDARIHAAVRGPFRAGSQPDRQPLVRRMALGLIRFYQAAISPTLLPACRYYPTCSAFAYEAIQQHGMGKGMWLAAKRLGRCHPFGSHGYDPVP